MVKGVLSTSVPTLLRKFLVDIVALVVVPRVPKGAVVFKQLKSGLH